MFKPSGGLDVELSLVHDNDPNNFQLDALGGAFPYIPKFQEKIIPTLGVKNQKQVNSCVCEAVSLQKEQDEKVIMSAGYLGSYLRSQKMMGENGTSIKNAISSEISQGIAEESISPTDHNSFYTFSAPQNLTKAGEENAATHKSKSYWQTWEINTILQQIDNDRVGVTGCMWYTGYNLPDDTAILNPLFGSPIFGHAISIIGYKLNHRGEKVLVFQNSYGSNWGDQGKFYIRFADFSKAITFSSYYVLDIDRDMASWLSLHAGNAIKKASDSKIYLIEGNVKRHIHDEAIFWMLGLSFKDVHVDTENMLDQIADGPEITIDDIPPVHIQQFGETLQALQNTIDVKRIFAPYANVLKITLN